MEGAASTVNAVFINYSDLEDWVYDSDDYFYYLDELAPGEETSSLMESVLFNPNTPSDVVCTKNAEGTKEVCESSGNGFDDATYRINITAETVQADKYQEVWGIDEIRSKYALFDLGIYVNKKIKKIANNMEGEFDYNSVNTNITAFKKSLIEPDQSIKNEEHLISNGKSNYPIYAWFDNGTMYWWSECSDVYLNDNSIALLAYCSELEDISGLSDIHASMVTTLQYTFAFDYKLADFSPIANWDTRRVNKLYATFYNCTSLTNTDYFQNWDVSKVTTFYSLFRHCTSLASLTGLSNWDVSSATSLKIMFYEDIALTSITGVENWNTSNVKDLYGTFGGSGSYKMNITSLTPLKEWNTSSVTTLYGTFIYNQYLTSLDGLEDWDTSNVTTLVSTFASNYDLSDISQLASWNTSKVQSLSNTFYYGESLTDHTALANWDTSNVTDMYFTFGIGRGGSKLNNAVIDYSPLHNWDTSKVTTMQYMFQNINILSFTAFEEWDVSNVKLFTGCFNTTSSCPTTTLHGLEDWDVSSATDMNGMFTEYKQLTDASAIDNWDVRNVTYFTHMFQQSATHPNFTKVNGTWSSDGTFTRTA